MGRAEQYALQYLGMAVGLLNQMDLVEKLTSMPDRTPEQDALLADVRERLPLEYALRVYPLLYVDGYTVSDLAKAAGVNDVTDVRTLPEVAREGALLLEAFEAAGMDPMARTRDIENTYGFSREEWGRLI